MIYMSSDLHFGHDRSFLYTPRGFSNIQEHDEAIIERFNAIVKPDDDLYLLGDLMLTNNTHGLECLQRLNGRLHILYGNHDTDARKIFYNDLPNVVEALGYAGMFKYRKWRFYLSHYPTITDNLDDVSKPWQQVKCLYGHTHQQANFYNDNPLMYHVGVDSHDCYPVSIDQIIDDIKCKFQECKEML